MEPEKWDNLHVQVRQAVCDYACVSERFADQAWEDIPELARESINAWVEVTPFAVLFNTEAENENVL